MSRTRYVASCSGGKDSVATLLLAAEHHEPLDEVLYCEVMFDKTTSGEVPEHSDFVLQKLKPFCEEKLGCPFTILHAKKTYDDVFHHVIVRGANEGMTRGFVWPGKCAVNRDCKLPALELAKNRLSGDTVSYIGIASDEPKRLARLDRSTKVSLLAKYGVTEAGAMELCRTHGLLSPVYERSKRNGCWFCPNATDAELRHMITHHPEQFDRLIAWEQEENLYHRRMTRRETPSELKARLLGAPEQAGLPASGTT